MMKLRQWLVSTALAVSVWSGGQDAYGLELHEALISAYQRNPELKAERQNYAAALENLPAAFAGWMPSASINYNINRERGSSSNTSSDQYTKPHSRSLSVSQPLYNGGQTMASMERAEHQAEAAYFTLRQVEQQVLTDAIVAYIDVIRTREVYKLSQNNEKVLTEQLDATNERFELGETTRTDVAQSKSRLAVSESDRINAQGNMLAAESEFKRVFLMDAPLEMETPADAALPALPETFSDFLERTLAGNPRLHAAEYNFEAGEAAIDIAKGGLLPSVSLNGSMVRTGGGGVGRLQSSETDRIGVDVTVPLYQSGSQYSTVRRSKKTAQSLRFQLEDIRNSTIDNATKAWKDLQTTRANIKAREVSQQAAEIALDGVRQEQEIGSRTILDVLDSEQELFQAKVNLVVARRNKVLAVYNILASMGRLTAEDLGLPVKLFDTEKLYDDTKYKMFGF